MLKLSIIQSVRTNKIIYIECKLIQTRKEFKFLLTYIPNRNKNFQLNPKRQDFLTSLIIFRTLLFSRQIVCFQLKIFYFRGNGVWRPDRWRRKNGKLTSNSENKNGEWERVRERVKRKKKWSGMTASHSLGWWWVVQQNTLRQGKVERIKELKCSALAKIKSSNQLQQPTFVSRGRRTGTSYLKMFFNTFRFNARTPGKTKNMEGNMRMEIILELLLFHVGRLMKWNWNFEINKRLASYL